MLNNYQSQAPSKSIQISSSIDQSKEDKASNKSEEYQREFIYLIKEIEKRQYDFDKQTQIRIGKWVRKFAEVCGNLEWEKNRNLHSILLLDSMLNNCFEDPYNKHPKDEHLPIINKSLVKAKMSRKFLELIGIIHIKEPKNLNKPIEKKNFLEKFDIKNKFENNESQINKQELNSNQISNYNSVDQTHNYQNNINQEVNLLNSSGQSFNNLNKSNNPQNSNFIKHGYTYSSPLQTNLHYNNFQNIDPDIENVNYNESILKRYNSNNKEYNKSKSTNKLKNFRQNFYDNTKHFPNKLYKNEAKEVKLLRDEADSLKAEIKVIFYLRNKIIF